EDYAGLAQLLRQEPAKATRKERTEGGVRKPAETEEEVRKLADQKIDEMLKAFPKSHQAWLLDARYAQAYIFPFEDAKERIQRDIDKALKLCPRDESGNVLDDNVVLVAAEFKET